MSKEQIASRSAVRPSEGLVAAGVCVSCPLVSTAENEKEFSEVNRFVVVVPDILKSFCIFKTTFRSSTIRRGRRNLHEK